MFREIVKFISDRTGFPMGPGSRIQFGHQVQQAPPRMVLIQEAGGATYFYPNEDMADFMVQVLCRAPSYFEAREDAWVVYKAIHGTSGWNLPRIDGSGEDYIAMTIDAVYLPQYLGEDEDRRHIFSTNYVFRMEEGSCREFVSGSP